LGISTGQRFLQASTSCSVVEVGATRRIDQLAEVI
jgi:hypothetical protein